MTVNPDDAVTRWGPSIATALGDLTPPIVSRVVALEETGSTQDVAREIAEPGVLVIAERQSAGRGRLGRVWHHRPGLGLAFSLTIDAQRRDLPEVSIAAGVAIALACESVIASPLSATLGVRWPNDVVERTARAGGGRKLAGVLIERAGPLGILGIGINVNHNVEDLASELRDTACSLRAVAGGGVIERRALLIKVLRELHASVVSRDFATLRALWTHRDVLRGSRQSLVCGGETVTGIIEDLEPLGAIRVRLDSGQTRTLPAATTSLVKP